MLEITKIHINYQTNPEGIEAVEQIGWKLKSDTFNVVQAAYEYQIAEDDRYKKMAAASGRVESEESVHVTSGLERLALNSHSRYYIRVRAWSTDGEASGWKEGSFITGILKTEEWKAQFITAEKDAEKEESRAYYYRREINIERKIKSAYAYVTALGLYHFYVNGTRVGEDEFTPGWTSYNKHLLYQTYDITACLEDGANVIAGLAGPGWYKGDIGSLRARNHYGDKTAFFCQIEVEYEDGVRECFYTDETWKCRISPIRFSEIYDGEIYDARQECRGWNKAGCADQGWNHVCAVTYPLEILKAQGGGRVKKIQEIAVKNMFHTPQGDLVIDFGQNLTGWVEFRIKGKKDEIAELICFETLDAEGNVYLDNLRTARQTIRYICSGKDEETFHPNFSYQGFQYIRIVSYPGKPEPEDFKAWVLHTGMEQTGKMECSNPDLNQLFHNILWGMKGNFLDVPTDCPQRDEHLGWTGDAQIFCRTATYLMDTYTFYSKWLRDVEADQTKEGGIPHVVPDIWTGKPVQGKIFEQGTHSAAGWGDAAVIVPWTLYQMYGDTTVIKRQYRCMKSWIEFMRKHARNNIWNYKLQFGDWVALDAEEGSYYGATPIDLTCTAYYAYSTELFSKMAGIIGETEDEITYRKLYEEIKETYQKNFLGKDGRLKVQTQTAQIISLYFRLLPESSREKAVCDLIGLLQKEGGHLVTGFMGTPYICHALSENGHTKKAFELLLKEDFPSWLYQVKQGATTVWEHWDGKRPDGSMWSPAMNSFNHYAYGAVGEWMFRAMAGIECSEAGPGFKEIIIRPHIGGNLKYVKTSYESIYGRIRTQWDCEGSEVRLKIEIPCNTRALICISHVKKIKKEGSLQFKEKDTEMQAQCGSGVYEILYEI